MHKILSQVEILGSPIMLGSSLISGLSTFLAEPAKARNPTEFARGVGTGSVTLVKMASFGILTFIGQVSCPPCPHLLLCASWQMKTARKLAGWDLGILGVSVSKQTYHDIPFGPQKVAIKAEKYTCQCGSGLDMCKSCSMSVQALLPDGPPQALQRLEMGELGLERL